MRGFRICTAFALLASVTWLAGCQTEPMNVDMSQMKPPPRPAELDRLSPLIGEWEATWDCKMPGAEQPMAGRGTTNNVWEADKRMVFERFEAEMGPMGKMVGVGLWTWNPQKRVYETFWYDNNGSSAHGTATYEDATRTFKMNGRGYDAMSGKWSSAEGTLRLVSNDMLEWSHAEKDMWGAKTMEMKGVSKRKK